MTKNRYILGIVIVGYTHVYGQTLPSSQHESFAWIDRYIKNALNQQSFHSLVTLQRVKGILSKKNDHVIKVSENLNILSVDLVKFLGDISGNGEAGLSIKEGHGILEGGKSLVIGPASPLKRFSRRYYHRVEKKVGQKKRSRKSFYNNHYNLHRKPVRRSRSHSYYPMNDNLLDKTLDEKEKVYHPIWEVNQLYEVPILKRDKVQYAYVIIPDRGCHHRDRIRAAGRLNSSDECSSYLHKIGHNHKSCHFLSEPKIGEERVFRAIAEVAMIAKPVQPLYITDQEILDHQDSGGVTVNKNALSLQDHIRQGLKNLRSVLPVENRKNRGDQEDHEDHQKTPHFVELLGRVQERRRKIKCIKSKEKEAKKNASPSLVAMPITKKVNVDSYNPPPGDKRTMLASPFTTQPRNRETANNTPLSNREEKSIIHTHDNFLKALTSSNFYRKRVQKSKEDDEKMLSQKNENAERGVSTVSRKEAIEQGIVIQSATNEQMRDKTNHKKHEREENSLTTSASELYLQDNRPSIVQEVENNAKKEGENYLTVVNALFQCEKFGKMQSIVDQNDGGENSLNSSNSGGWEDDDDSLQNRDNISPVVGQVIDNQDPPQKTTNKFAFNRHLSLVDVLDVIKASRNDEPAERDAEKRSTLFKKEVVKSASRQSLSGVAAMANQPDLSLTSFPERGLPDQGLKGVLPSSGRTSLSYRVGEKEGEMCLDSGLPSSFSPIGFVPPSPPPVIGITPGNNFGSKEDDSKNLYSCPPPGLLSMNKASHCPRSTLQPNEEENENFNALNTRLQAIRKRIDPTDDEEDGYD